ncbi:yippee-like protein [Calocera cornea HHB12733]|uniref:Protein yippee-like n=1 Tax=Calocera cornea HHB12733 TaxID=1353952 RepID=A0A165DGI8_9BASI|nr:yippee-like protein [Calocera cornea HHB12733]
MGMTLREYLNGKKIFGCNKCRAHIANVESIISKAFNGQHGRAYLFEFVVNVVEGAPEDRAMTTGLHTVRDIFCVKCNQTLGWKYDKAFEQSQKYKEGKYILERTLLIYVE